MRGEGAGGEGGKRESRSRFGWLLHSDRALSTDTVGEFLRKVNQAALLDAASSTGCIRAPHPNNNSNAYPTRLPHTVVRDIGGGGGNG